MPEQQRAEAELVERLVAGLGDQPEQMRELDEDMPPMIRGGVRQIGGTSIYDNDGNWMLGIHRDGEDIVVVGLSGSARLKGA